MNTFPPDQGFESEPSGFDSLNSVNVICDGPGDTIVRPATGVLLQLAIAEREKIARWQHLMNEQSLESPQRGRVSQGEPFVREFKQQFEALAREWAEHCSRGRFSSILADYLDHPAYREIVRLGPAVIPWIIEHYRAETLPWGFALQDITGVRMIADPNEFSPPDVRRRWLEWWEKQGSKLPLSAVPVGLDARSVDADPKQ